MPKAQFHLYTDGAAFNGSNRYGIGWVRTSGKHRFQAEQFKRLIVDKPTSLIAEIYAVVDGLDAIKVHREGQIKKELKALAQRGKAKKVKKSGKKLQEIYEKAQTRVVLHTDCDIICTTLAIDKLETRIHNSRGSLKQAWEALGTAVQRHTSVDVVFERADKDQEGNLMTRAHCLAQLGAQAAFNKAAPKEQKQTDKSAKKGKRPRNRRVDIDRELDEDRNDELGPGNP